VKVVPRLIAVDVDGTLLGSGYRLSPRTRQAVHAVRRTGVFVTIATGRPYNALTELVDMADWAITSNGSQATHVASGETPYAITFQRAAAVEFVQHARARVPGVRFSFITNEDMGWEEGFDRFFPSDSLPGALVRDVIAEVGGELVQQLAAYHPVIAPKELEIALQGIADADHLRAEHLGFPAVEIAPPSVDKAVALAWLTGHLGFAQADVWAFGDGMNDVRMLSWAGQGIAMGNADDDVKAVADRVTATNDDHGVAVVLEQLVAARQGRA
jgi:Cof subfamily protein (haloacid dehalogenase superfamily)